MPLGPNDAGNTDPFLGSQSLSFKFPVTGGAPGTVTPSADRNGVSSDISDELGLSDNTQGDLAPSAETLEGQHADALYNVPGNMSQKPMPREGFTAAEVAANLQVSQQQQSSFPYTRVESSVEPVAAQGSDAASPVHSDVENEVPALKQIGVVVRDGDPMNDMVHSDPFRGSEEAPLVPAPSAPSDLAVVLSYVNVGGTDKYRMSFTWDAAPAGEDVIAWELCEEDENGNFWAIVIPHSYPWINTTPNSLLDRTFTTTDNTDVLLDRVSSGTFTFAVRAINSIGARSPISNEVSVNLFAAPANVVLNANGTASWSAVAGIGAVGYQYQIDNNATPGLVWVSNADTDLAGLDLSAFAGGGTAYLHVRVAGSPRFATDTVIVP